MTHPIDDIERLAKIIEPGLWLVPYTKNNNLEGLKLCARKKAKRVLEAGFSAHKTQESEWVKIEDIPEEWKDGRDIWLIGGAVFYYQCDTSPYQIPSKGEAFKGCFDKDAPDFWIGSPCADYSIERPTHAMLPPAPPKETT